MRPSELIFIFCYLQFEVPGLRSRERVQILDNFRIWNFFDRTTLHREINRQLKKSVVMKLKIFLKNIFQDFEKKILTKKTNKQNTNEK